MDWRIWVVVAVAVITASWGLLVLLSTHLPDGTLKDLAGFLPGPRDHRAAAAG
jgi:hypothetical protein